MLTNLIKKWHKSMDYSFLLCTFAMLLTSIVLVYSSSPSVAKRILLREDFFIQKHMIFVSVSVFVMLVISMLSRDVLLKLSNFCTVICLSLLFIVLILGDETKGAKRWIYFYGMSLEPSEILKPFFSVSIASILSSEFENKKFICTALHLLVIALLLLQPNLSMSIIMTSIWACQIFIAGISYVWLLVSLIAFLLAIGICYTFIPYIRNRIISFIDPIHNDTFQISKSIEAFKHGKLFGVGVGKGTVKLTIPDCHTDLILAVAAEELGSIICIALILIFGFIITKGWIMAYKEENFCNLLIIAGLVTQFTVQFLINIGVTLKLLPTTGVVLPLISYGGSSLMANSIVLGMLLSFARYAKLNKRLMNYYKNNPMR